MKRGDRQPSFNALSITGFLLNAGIVTWATKLRQIYPTFFIGFNFKIWNLAKTSLFPGNSFQTPRDYTVSLLRLEILSFMKMRQINLTL